jgi:hypothetical protein
MAQALADYQASGNDWTDAFVKQAAGQLADCLKKWDTIGLLNGPQKNLLHQAETYRV